MVVHSGLLDMFARDDACVAAGVCTSCPHHHHHHHHHHHRHHHRHHHLNCSLFVCQCSPTRPVTLYAAIQPSSKVRQAAACSVQGQHACTSLTLSRTGVRALVSSAVFFASAILKIDFNLTRGASNLLLQLPHSRTMETEADAVGMHLLAKVPAFSHLMPPPPLPLLLLPLKLFGHLLQACIDPSAMVRVFQTFQQHAKSESLLGPCVTRHTPHVAHHSL